MGNVENAQIIFMVDKFSKLAREIDILFGEFPPNMLILEWVLTDLNKFAVENIGSFEYMTAHATEGNKSVLGELELLEFCAVCKLKRQR